MKISCSCMLNMAAILFRHNKSILASKNTTVHPTCNCRCKTECPLNSKYHKKVIICNDDNNTPKYHYGCCEMEFESRFYNHCHSFKSKPKRNMTELSKAIWEAINNGKDTCIKWSISSISNIYRSSAARCNLCLDKKLSILLADPSLILNKRTELTGKCWHKNKFKLKMFSCSPPT